jgi:hypothetical protein
MKQLDHLVTAARESDLEWNDERSGRVLSSALDRRERRATRNRLARRALVVGSAFATIGFLFLRGASASSAPSSEIEPSANANAVAAAATFGDAGYARD